MKQTCDKTKRFSDVPHFELIVPDGKITIPSLFMFKGGCEELFPFLLACREMRCVVEFENEQIIVDYNGENKTVQDFVLSIYAHIAEHPKIAEDYIRYLSNLDKMNWVKGVHEPILSVGGAL